MEESSERDLSNYQITILVVINTIFSGVSLFFCTSMIVLYLRNRYLKNFFTNLFVYLMISEAVYSLGKFVSIFKLFSPDTLCFTKYGCFVQGFLICCCELSSFLWIIYIAFSLYRLLKYHRTKNNNFWIVTFFGFPILVALALSFCDKIGAIDESKVVWCWIKIFSGFKQNFLMILIYSLYLAFIGINIYFYCMMNNFVNQIKDKVSDNVSQVTRYLKRTSLIFIVCYVVAFSNRLIQCFDFPPKNIILFICYVLHIILMNSKGSLFFLFCLDKNYREHLTDLILLSRERVQTLNSDKEEQITVNPILKNLDQLCDDSALLSIKSVRKATIKEGEAINS